METTERPLWVRRDVDDDDSQTRCWVNEKSQKIDLGDGLYIHEQVEARTRGWDFDVTVRIGVQDGRLIAKSVEVARNDAGVSITSEILRTVPVANLVRYGARAVQHGELASAWPSEDEAAYVARHGLDDETLRIVARVYRVAYLLGDPPTRKVETLFKVPRSTAGRWVAAAREKGFLGKAEGPGKAGR